MATEVRRRRGTTAQHGSFTGAVGEVTVDTDKDTLIVHDGATLGGFEILRQDLSNISDTDIFTKLSLETNIANLTSAEISQLENIGTLTFSAQSWANLNDISLINVADGDFIVGSATGWVAESGATARTSLGVAIGSDVQAWDAQLDTLSGLSAGAATALAGISAGTASALVDVTSAEFTQIQNINGVSITNTQWGYLGALDQALATTDSPTFAGLTLTGALSGTSATFSGAGTFGNTMSTGQELEVGNGTGFSEIAISSQRKTTGQNIGRLSFYGYDSLDNATTYAGIKGSINSPANTAEYGELIFEAINNGSFADLGNWSHDEGLNVLTSVYVNNAETHLYRNATTGNYGAQTLGNATLRIQDSSANMYIDGNSITLDQSGYLDAGGSTFSFAFNGGLKAIMNSNGFTFTDSVQFNDSITGTTATFDSLTINGTAFQKINMSRGTGSSTIAMSNDTNNIVLRGGSGANAQLNINDDTGLSLLRGALDISGSLTGTTATFTDTTQATSSSVASVELSGGLGIAKDVFISSTSDIYTDDFALGSDGTGWLGQSTPASGFGVVNGTTSDMYIDNLTVRGRLRAYELIIKQISTIGGTEIMSIAAGIVESVSGAAPHETLTIEDPRGFGGNAFAVGDLIVVQTVDLNDPTNAVKQEWRRVSSVTGNNIGVGSLTGAPAPTSRIAEGDAVVAFGSDTTPSRQNIIYRNVEGGAPLVRLHAGVNSYANFATAENTTVMAYGEMNGLVTGISSSEIGMIIGDPTLTSNYILATENQFEANLDTFTLEAGTADSLLITSDTSTQTAYTPTDDTSALVTNASLTSSVTFYGTFTTVDESLGWEGDRLSFGTLSYNGTSDRIEMTMDCTGVTSSNRLRVWQDQETMTNYQNKTITFNFNLSTLPTSAAWSTTISTHLIIYAYDSGTRREIARETIGAVSSTPADKSVTAHIPEWADSFRWAIVADEGNYTSLTTDRTLYINSITTDVYDKVQTTLNTDGLTVYGSPINELKFTKSDGVQIKGAKIRGNWMMLPEYKNENDLPTPDAGYASVAIIEVGGNKELWIRDDAGTTHSVTLT